jgi:hypothetical protein
MSTPFLKEVRGINNDIRDTACAAKVKLWQIAARLNMHDGSFSRKLRKELSDAEKAHIIQIIDELSKEGR